MSTTKTRLFEELERDVNYAVKHEGLNPDKAKWLLEEANINDINNWYAYPTIEEERNMEEYFETKHGVGV